MHIGSSSSKIKFACCLLFFAFIISSCICSNVAVESNSSILSLCETESSIEDVSGINFTGTITTDKQDYVYRYLTEESEFCSAIIPHINISPKLNNMVNTDIDSLFTNRISDANEHKLGYYSVHYCTSIYENILSLMVWSDEGTSPGVKPIVYTVSIDLDTKLILTLPSIMDYLGYDYLKTMNDINSYSTYIYDPAVIMKTDPDLYYDMIFYQFDDDQFFVDEEGQLFMIGSYQAIKFISLTNSDPLNFTVDWELFEYGLLYDVKKQTFRQLQ